MKTLRLFFFVLLTVMLASCDLRSGTAKREMEKFTSSPTPLISPAPTGTPIAPADIVAVDINLSGESVSVNADKQSTTASCPKFNRLLINGDGNKIAIKGVCKQIMINGDKNEITADASMEIVLNGTENIVRYARFANGIRPSVVENQAGNTIEKISVNEAIKAPSRSNAGK